MLLVRCLSNKFDDTILPVSGFSSLKPRVRKFASGFDRRFRSNHETGTKSEKRHHEEEQESLPPTLSLEEQEVVLRFHANQICKLVGPAALFPELRRSPKVVSTAIMLFRRFYLSNSVLDFDCRHAATAAALLSCKVEEERVQVRKNILFPYRRS